MIFGGSDGSASGNELDYWSRGSEFEPPLGTGLSYSSESKRFPKEDATLLIFGKNECLVVQSWAKQLNLSSKWD